MANAVRIADKRPVRPEKVVVAKPISTLFVKKPAAQIMSERLYTRVTKAEKRRLDAVLRKRPASELLRDLLIAYLDKKDHERPRKKK